MVGFFDGLVLGERFSYWNLLTGKDGTEENTQTAKVMASFEKYYKLMKGSTNDQFRDGLDKLYSDYRNRRIPVWPAVWLVANSIAGKTDREMEILIENARRSAGQ